MRSKRPTGDCSADEKKSDTVREISEQSETPSHKIGLA
jgi:hypothetical protein